VLAAVVAAVLLAFWLGRVSGATARWDEAAAQIIGFESRDEYNFVSLQNDDWSYAFQQDAVRWIDAENVWHESGLPECITSQYGSVVRFAWVEARVEGSRSRVVVLVDCRG
jgi:hypothetical protein